MSDRETGKAEDADLIEVVVELRPVADAGALLPKARRIESMKAAFDRETAPVEQWVSGVGGAVTGRAWINHSLKVRVPAGAVTRLKELPEVAAVELPRALLPDAG